MKRIIAILLFFISILYYAPSVHADDYTNEAILEKYTQMIQGTWIETRGYETGYTSLTFYEETNYLIMSNGYGNQGAMCILVASSDSPVYLGMFNPDTGGNFVMFKILFSLDGKFMVLINETNPNSYNSTKVLKKI